MSANRYSINPAARSVPRHCGLLQAEEYEQVQSYFGARPESPPTPLRRLTGLAGELNLHDVWLKDESVRFNLNSFKILGVSYAVARLLSAGLITRSSVLACATEGNHGRAVARVASENSLAAKVYVSADMAVARVEAIAQDGAEVIRVRGGYDEAVRRMARDAELNGWVVVSDTSWPGYEMIPRWIIAGYTRLMDEALEQWSPDPSPDLVIVQAGVGGLACAALSWLCYRYGERRPQFIVCEPASAASLLESHRAGELTSLSGPFDTIMVGLRSGDV